MCDFEEQKIQMKISNNIFVTLIPKGTKPHCAIFPRTILLIRTHPTARCAVLTFLYI